jgi:hypothetical protein
MNAFRGVVLMLVGTAWGLLWITVFASIQNLPTGPSGTTAIQIAVFFIMLFGIVPFGFGINRLVR